MASGDVRHMSAGSDRPRVLVLARSYPNNVLGLLGLWAQQLVVGLESVARSTVVSPVPWCPPLPGIPAYYTSYRSIERRRLDHGVEVLHPRLLVGPTFSLRRLEAATYYAAVRRPVARLRQTFPFDLIHAHFTYPDGVVGALLARKYGVPLVITEQVPWLLSDEAGLVARQMRWAARRSSVLLAVSRAVRHTIESALGPVEGLRVIPDAVDGSIFTLPPNGARWDRRQILFVGAVRPFKGVDVLLRAMRILADDGVEARLVLVGEAYYATYRDEQERLRALTTELELEDRVEFRGPATPAEVAATMQQSALLVLPSRAESLGMVLIEALACGTPVVATRCGGPEDIVNDDVGILVPPEDAPALASALNEVLEHRDTYERSALRRHALENFGIEPVSARYAQVYREALGGA